MNKAGIIKSISRKDSGKNAFTLVGEKLPTGADVWFMGDALLAEKGDTIEFELDINGTWHNFSNVRIIAKANRAPQMPYPGQPPIQPPIVQSQPVAQATPPVSGMGISFIELNGQTYKIIMERMS